MAEVQRPDHQRPPTPASPYPLLLLVDSEDKKKQLFYDISDGSKSEKTVPELEHPMYPFSSNFGWVVIMGDYDPEQRCLTGNEGYYLWNPLTLESIPLPPLQLEEPREYIIGMQLTAPPDNPDSAFVMFVDRPRCIYLCRINDDDKVWVRRDCSEEITDWHVYCKTVVSNDKIYSLQKKPRLVWEIEMEKEKPHKISLKPISFTEPMCQSNCRDYWAELSGDIFCIQLEPGRGDVMRNIAVSKLDLSSKALKEIKSFPDKVFFVDPYKAVCCPAHSENMGNKVFFTLPGSNVLYTYDAEDQSISTAEPFPGIPSVMSSPASWILPNLPPSQMIARSCQSVSPVEEFKVKNNLSSPYLILPLVHKRVISIVDPVDDERKCFPTIPFQIPDNARILYSRNGWLLMSSARVSSIKSLFMYNPLTRDVIPLPELEMSDYRDTNDFFFLSSPESSDFLVVAINYLVVFALIRPGDMKKWKVFDVPLVGYRLSAFHSSHVFIGDTLYYLGDTGNLHVVRVKEPDSFFLTSVEVRIPGSGSYQQSYLVACYGQLLAVHVGDAGKSIKVFKLSGSGTTSMGWKPLKSLGENCLYLSKVSTLAVKSEIPRMKNRIYLGRFYGEYMVYYSMETSKLHYSVLREGKIVEESLNDFNGTIEHLNSCWFEPKLKTREEPTDPASSVMIDKLVRRTGLKLVDDDGRIKTNLLSRHLSKHVQL